MSYLYLNLNHYHDININLITNMNTILSYLIVSYPILSYLILFYLIYQGRVVIFDRMQCIANVALTDRCRREAAESGRRQKEEIMMKGIQ